MSDANDKKPNDTHKDLNYHLHVLATLASAAKLHQLLSHIDLDLIQRIKDDLPGQVICVQHPVGASSMDLLINTCKSYREQVEKLVNTHDKQATNN